mmetsp:Transcript_49185/g.128349  ORF Transcript_49185/g.128349 Transcript_49185/m.128349 type:complete len:533 (+) Transcript_49185:133-1731(+)
MSIKISDAETMKLRFDVGTRVECNCGQWKPGTVVKHFYVQKSFPEGMCVPYQVQLDDKKLIFAPADEERVIRQLLTEPDPAYIDDEDYVEDIKDEDKTPVTVITGFLGSGKTTLINHILKEKHGTKVCVIENEFGAVDIDTSLVKENLNVAEEIISLDNGCACCTVRGDLLKALSTLKERRKDFDMVLVETTGLANPAPVVATFTQNATIANHFRVDGIVCMVDSKYVKDHIDEVRKDDAINESVCQIAFADRIILNKIDLVSQSELKELKETVVSINAFAELFETERSRVPIDKLLNIASFSIERMNASLEEFEIDLPDPEPEVGHEHGHAAVHEHGHASEHGHADGDADCDACAAESDHGHAESDHGHASDHGHSSGGGVMECEPETAHGHDEKDRKKKKKHDLSGVGSLGLTAPRPLLSHEFNAFMSELLRTKAADLYRSKGVLAFVEEGDAKFIFQGVHENIQYTTALEPWKEDEARISKCVFIGRQLDHDMLRIKWEKCISPEPGLPPTPSRGILGAAKDAAASLLG